ncbi:MAG: peptidoglycan-binding domain-containing protein [Burkholderiaceae bacterium]
MQRSHGNRFAARMLQGGFALGDRDSALGARLGSGRSASLVQRRIGDGHDLSAARFAGDPVLEACFDNERVLTTGSSGEAVRRIQQALMDAGFPLPKFGVDGKFGSETRAALRDFQAGAGIKIDGIVGPETMQSLDTRFSSRPGPTPPTPPQPTPPQPTPPAPLPATIVSETVATSPGLRTRTKVGVGEEIDLTHSAGSTTWSVTKGKLSATTGAKVRLTAPDVAQTITVTAGTTTLNFTVVAPTGVHMDRFPGSGIKHTFNQADSGIMTLPFLLPDDVNFLKVIYREMDVAGVASVPGVYSCNPFSGGHCGAGGGGAPCNDLSMTDTVVAGKGTQAVLGDCAYSGHCGTAPPFKPGTVTVSIPYQFKVGTGPFRQFTTVVQVHALAADAATLASDKAGAHGDTTVGAAGSLIPQCP